MTGQTMTDERLLALIEAYGAEPGGWPEAEREAAEAHLKADKHRFEGALAEARALDMVFAREAVPEVPAGLSARLLAEAPVPRPASASRGFTARLRTLFLPEGLRWPAGAALASLMMGLIAGYATAPATANDGYQSETEEVVYAALGYGGVDSYLDGALE